jgi:hypothetical protein
MPLKVNLAHHPLHPFGVEADLSHVLAQDPQGHVLRWGGAAPPQQLHEHERLVDVAHAHPLGDVRAQAKEGQQRGAEVCGLTCWSAAARVLGRGRNAEPPAQQCCPAWEREDR